MIIKEIFEEIKNDYKRYGEVLQMEYFDDWVDDSRVIFRVEGDNLIVYIRDDIEEFEIMFTMDIEFIIKSTVEDCIKEYNKCYYYAPNVYEPY